MAIHEELPSITVSIEVDGVSLTEHLAPNDPIKHDDPLVRAHQSGCTVTNYVECITGKNFGIRSSIDATFKWDCPRLGFHVSVDGEYIDEQTFSRRKFNKKNYNFLIQGCISREGGEMGTLHQFMFNEINTTSDTVDAADIQIQKEQMSKIGEIVVKVYRESEGVAAGGIYKRRKLSNLGKDINEKALKGEAKSHGISFGATVAAAIPSRVRCDRLDGEDYPIAIFKFKYRSNEALKQLHIIQRTLEALKQLHIIQRTPEPSPEPEGGSILDGLTPEELRALKKLAQKLKTGRDDGVLVKVEGRKSNEKGNAKKRPASSISSEIVDLTKD